MTSPSAPIGGVAMYGQVEPGGFFFTWLFLTYIPTHVYLATRADLLERGGSISSIISDRRFVGAGQHFADE